MNEMEVLSSYIGRQYSFRRFNCWDCAVEIRKEFDIKTKLFKPATLKESFKVITAQMQKLESGLTLVSSPDNFDIIIVSRIIGKNKVYHCGIYHDKNVIHCCPDFGSVRYESIDDFRAKYKEVTLWR